MSVTMADARASRKVLDAKKPIDRVQSLAETIIFCMSEDAPQAAPSGNGTPGTATPVPHAISRLQNGMKKTASTDSLAAAGRSDKGYIGGSKALDHLSRLLTSCETVCLRNNIANLSSSIQATLDTGRLSSQSFYLTLRATSSRDGRVKKNPRARLQLHGA
jgi:proteasome activator subunit 4